MVNTNEFISSGTPMFSRDSRRAVGKVAFDEDVENAVTAVVFIFRKKSKGESADKKYTEAEYTTNPWISRPPSTTKINHNNANNRSIPKDAILLKTNKLTA